MRRGDESTGPILMNCGKSKSIRKDAKRQSFGRIYPVETKRIKHFLLGLTLKSLLA